MIVVAKFDKEIRRVQKALIAQGYDLGPDGADGYGGKDTLKAVNKFQADNGLPVGPVITSEFRRKLFKESEVENPASSNWFSMLTGSTFFQYLIAMVATFIASKLGIEKGDVLALITQIIGIIPAAIGVWNAARSKVVVNGTVVPLKAMPLADQSTVATIAKKNA
jgi:peptidoglycan hydrolase-like protein with peptidoglycan-binding domain